MEGLDAIVLLLVGSRRGVAELFHHSLIGAISTELKYWKTT